LFRVGMNWDLVLFVARKGCHSRFPLRRAARGIPWITPNCAKGKPIYGP
jgi:hypothetical protein